jgi:hypothetical protein
MSKTVLNYNNFGGTRGSKGDKGAKGDSVAGPNPSTLNGIVTWGNITGTSLSDSTIPIYAHDDSIGIGINSQVNGTTKLKCVSIGENTLKDGTDNVKQIAIGPFAMEKMTGAGYSNIAIGHRALTTSVESSSVIAIGEYCCNDSTSASNMICIGNSVAQLSTDNYLTICIGNEAGYNSGGTWNILIGHSAGYSYTGSDTNNIIIGHNSNGIPGESNTIRIGSGQSNCRISGIYGVYATADKTVVINSDGQLGTVDRLPISFNTEFASTRFKDTRTNGGDYDSTFDIILSKVGRIVMMSITTGMNGTLGGTSLISCAAGVPLVYRPTENIIDKTLAIGNTTTDCMIQITTTGDINFGVSNYGPPLVPAGFPTGNFMIGAKTICWLGS